MIVTMALVTTFAMPPSLRWALRRLPTREDERQGAHRPLGRGRDTPESQLGRHNLIVLGVSRRPGETLSFGSLATALLETSEKSLMFVAPAGRRSSSTERTEGDVLIE